ncbi:ABC transporter permease subunit [Saccharopolyspora shandongensis]|uniref:ABC transporter permease subunit n=1 Tax=Saccharopolyspora shandongensis TaxID=418495 RepID=UPI003439020E
MIWVAWRQHRAQLITLAALLLLGSATVLVLHASMTGDIEEYGLQACLSIREKTPACAQTRVEFQKEWFDLIKVGQGMVFALPVLLGAFFAAPLFAREIEHGTHVLAFTQSVSRLRWMTTKVAVLLLPSAVVVVVLQLLVARWVAAAGLLGPLRSGPFQWLSFDTTGPMPVVHLLFSFALGALLGAVMRRSLMALSATLGTLVVLRVVVTNVAPNFLPVQRLTTSDPTISATPSEPGAMVLDSGFLGKGGQILRPESSDVTSCPIGVDFGACYAEKGLTGTFADVISPAAAPGLQLAEFAVFGLAAVLLLVGTAWTLQRQH